MIDACPDTPAGRRDAALVAVMRCGLLRGIEAARARWADLDRQPDGTAWLNLGATKTDPHARGRRRVMLDPGTVELIDRMAADAGDDPRLFRLSAGTEARPSSDQIRIRIRIAGERAGVEGMSAHSIRRGGAHDVLAGGGSIAALLDAGGWRSLRTGERYVSELGGETPRPAILQTRPAEAQQPAGEVRVAPPPPEADRSALLAMLLPRRRSRR
ncbi:MAG: tyrosine-type recombinase/integrase [Gammaproteobacteria bacterium]|nr:tyrosine-type recombinase/integrase [Gammaproteobacteria bacterium]